MPLAKSEFRVSLLDLKHHGNDIIQHMMKRAGSDIGIKIQEMIPFKKDEEKSFSSQPYFEDKERLMEQGMHYMYPAPEDHYKLELFVTSGEDWFSFRKKLFNLLHGGIDRETLKRVEKLLIDLETVPQPQNQIAINGNK